MNEIQRSQFLIYQSEDGRIKLDVRFQNDTVWLTQAMIVDLFQSSKANVSEHIANIFAEGELTPESTVRKFRTVRQEGSRQVERELEFYNLDLIISVVYRIKSNLKFQVSIHTSAGQSRKTWHDTKGSGFPRTFVGQIGPFGLVGRHARHGQVRDHRTGWSSSLAS